MSGSPEEGAGEQRCARCGGPFHCGVQDALPCWCAAVAVDAGTLMALARRFDGCLCPRCLAEAAQEKKTAGH